MNPISLCIISKNDPHIVHAINSIRQYVSEVIIVDTGSSQDLKDLSRQNCDVFFEMSDCNDENGLINDFSKARNKSFQLASQAWILWMDSDDIIEGGENLKNILSHYKSPISIMFPYEYAYDDNGKSILNQYRERLFYKGDPLWSGKVHEICSSSAPQIQLDSLIFKHQRQYLRCKEISEPGRNLRILKNQEDKSPRDLFYLAQEYYDHNMKEDAIETYKQYIKVSNWPDEEVQALLRLSELTNDLQYAFRIIQLKPHWFEGFYAAGKIFYHQSDWKSCVDFLLLGLNQGRTETPLFINESERKLNVHKYLNFALNNLGRIEEALNSCNLGLSYAEDAQLLQNKNAYLNHLNAVPKGPLNIVFALGDGLQTWDSESVKRTGIGGSELMAIHMSQQLSKLGHHVTIYNSCQNKTVLDGVTYDKTKNLKNHQNCDVLIVSRYAHFLASIPAKKKLLWVHDIQPQYLTKELYILVDKIMVLSNWHKQNVMQGHPYIEENKIFITKNGIDMNRFKAGSFAPRDPYRCINSSSPERSWNTLLDCWPFIKANVPKANLHLYYGFDDLEKSIDNINMVDMLKKRLKRMETLDVFYHGRVNQDILAEEFQKSSVWLYPTNFLETFCIGALEAQAAKNHMVTSNLAALNETAKDGVLIPFGHPRYNDFFIQAATNALLQSSNMIYPQYDIQEYNLEEIALSWINLIRNI